MVERVKEDLTHLKGCNEERNHDSRHSSKQRVRREEETEGGREGSINAPMKRPYK